MTTTTMPDKVESFAHEKLKGQYRTRYQSPKLHDFLKDPDQDLKKFGGNPPIKDDQTTTVSIVPNLVEDCPIVIKRYNTQSAWHALHRTLRHSLAENCWNFAGRLQKLGVATAPPVAFIQEYITAGIKGRSWYLSEFVDGPSCLDYLPSIDDETVREQRMEQIIDTLKLLWKHRITHGNLRGRKILLAQDQIVLLDLDAMKQHEDEETARSHIGKDMERFLLNWKKDHPHPALYELTRNKLVTQLPH